jgi:hypothetical protein
VVQYPFNPFTSFNPYHHLLRLKPRAASARIAALARESSQRSSPEIASETRASVNADVQAGVMDVSGFDRASPGPSNLWGFT